MANFNRGDLDFILQQIQIAEQHAAGTPLSTLIPDPLVQFGLRTVDGRDNNIVPGRAAFGSADQIIPRMTTPVFNPAEATTFDVDGPGPATVGTPTSYAQTRGPVFDSQPRTISNLIVDQTVTNQAAVEAWFQNGLAQAAYQETHPGITPIRPGQIPDATHLVVTNQDLMIIQNIAPDFGLTVPFNSWFTYFGQFFDHGLDLVNKGGSGTVFVPLKPDDPLIPGPDHILNDDPTTAVDESADNLPAHLQFMALTRATMQPGPDGVVGTADDIHENVSQTTPWIDQNQTYTSHPSHQVFLREHVLDASGHPVATGRFLDGANGGLANWAEIKLQARTILGIELTDADVTNGPLMATDPYGRLILSAGGKAQMVTGLGADNALGGTGVNADTYLEGDLSIPVSTATALRTGHEFLTDIAHTAAPRNSNGTMKTPDADIVAGVDDNLSSTYDNELLDAHFATGDGRGNENIALTTVHTIFHAEHNRLAGQTQALAIESAQGGDFTFLNEWLTTPIAVLPVDLSTLSWNGERLFQAARFGTEMQYQHLAFEEFARRLDPGVNLFGGYHTDIDPTIVAEFSHTVYRFGHSMLTDTVARTNLDGTTNDIGLIQAFLNPLEFARSGGVGGTALDSAGAIIRGLTHQVGNEIDEFVVEAVRNNLLGLPLDLPALNIARGRDTGIPSLNAARHQFFADTGNAALKPYDSWSDYAFNLRHPESLINFIAAYGTHTNIVSATTLADKRAAATLIVLGGTDAPLDRLEFLNSTGSWASNPGGVTTTGLDAVDFWIGGLAEEKMPVGGMLGSTFTFVFETQMERLQDGDRLYYLNRTPGMHFAAQLEENSFAELIQNNIPNIGHLPGRVFLTPTYTFELANLGASGPILDDPKTPYNESALLTRLPDGTVRYATFPLTAAQTTVMGGTPGDDRMMAGAADDDTLWGDAGNDRLDGGAGNDILIGGAGDDFLTDPFGDDVIKGQAGNDIISGGAGLDLLFGGDGRDFILHGVDPSESFGGQGDDIIRGGPGADVVFGGEGDDWIEGGAQADLLQGDNGDPFQLSRIIGNDVIMGTGNDDYDGESGDDIGVMGEGTQRDDMMLGFDWAIHKGDTTAVNSDLLFTGLLPAVGIDALRDRFDLTEALSGWKNDDILRGDNRIAVDMVGHELKNVDLISGLADLLVITPTPNPNDVEFTGGNIILGGDGSDIIEGRGGNDYIDGDAWLNVRLSVRDANNVEIGTADTIGGVLFNKSGSLFDTLPTLTLQAAVLAGTIQPGQISIVREIVTGGDAIPDFDTAVFSGNFANYTISGADANGRRTITDNVGTNGTDTIRNIETLQFADGNISLTGANQVATGTVTISDITPTEDQFLTATRNFTDLNGVVVSTIVFTWQAETSLGTWVDVGIGPTFQPGDAQVGLSLRVVATFDDLSGHQETVLSAPTAAVLNINDAPTGVPTISDTSPTEGVAVTAESSGIADVDGISPATVFMYQWQVQDGAIFVDIAGATSASFTPTQNQVNLPIRVVSSYTDVRGGFNQATSAATIVVGDLRVGTALNDTLNGTAGDDNLQGLAGNDTLNGLAGDDLLFGGDGVDNLNGGLGADTMEGGLGSDTYNVDNLLDSVTETETALAGGGTDTVRTTLADYVLGPNVENLTFTGVGDFNGTGNALVNRIQGGGGNDSLDGGLGSDTLLGGAGDDAYFVNSAGDVITEGGGGGTDTVFSTSTSFRLGANVENLRHIGSNATTVNGNTLANIIDGGAFNDVLNGLGGNDTINGDAGNDTINGGGGDDSMDGGLGNDTFIVDTLGDSVAEAAGQGTDTVRTSLLSYTLGSDIENLTFTGPLNATTSTISVSGVGNALVNTIRGNSGADTLDGGGGADALIGGAGNDTYVINNASVSITDSSGVDKVLTTLNSYTLGASLENLTFTGSGNFSGTGHGGANTITGGSGNDNIVAGGGIDRLIGGAGDDFLNGGTGNDIFVFASAGFGSDTIGGALADRFDFSPDLAGLQDLLDISGLGITALTYGADVALVDTGTDVRVDIGGGHILLVGVANVGDISASDFILA